VSDGDEHPATVMVEAVAALAEAAGRLHELGRTDTAHRCDQAAARMQLTFAVDLEELQED
jgi:hypothetical protein